MAERVHPGFLSSLRDLKADVMSDVRRIGQETADLARESRESAKKTGRIGSVLAAGAVVAIIGVALLCVMLVFLLAYLAPSLPLWACYAIIGFPVLGIGIGMIVWAMNSRKAITEPLQEKSARVVRDIQQTKENAAQQITAARESLQETVDNVRHTFMLREQVDRHPWPLMGGALALGFFGGILLREHRASQSAGDGRAPGATRRSVNRLANTIGPELSHLRSLAVGALLGALRDFAASSIPQPLEKEVEGVIDNVTEKLGGKPIRSRASRESPNGHPSGVGAGAGQSNE